MIRSGDGKLSPSAGRQSATVQSTTHILKLWDADEYPHLAANEFFCLEAARRLGLPVPTALLSDDGGALIVERFDLATERYLGFEDFCVLNGLQSRDKYRGSYETRLWKRLRDFVPVEDFAAQAEQLFRLFVLNCCLRNGDAHLKNFGLLYDEVDSAARLAPVYDLVTTTAYLPADRMALTLDGSTEWPDAKRLTRLGQVRAELSSKSVRLVFEAVSDAVADTRPAMVAYFAGADAALGARVAAAWNQGLQAMSER
jgi:serine/threonine-protein kinase HipA